MRQKKNKKNLQNRIVENLIKEKHIMKTPVDKVIHAFP